MITKRIEDISIFELTDALRKGDVIAYPTDTVYGLLADASRETAVRRIFHIKGRSFTKPLPLFVDSVERAKTLAVIDGPTERTLKKIWPGPVTVVLKKRDAVPGYVTAGKDSVGLRMPENEGIMLLITELNAPLTGTSANISGKPPCRNVSELWEQFSKHHPQPDILVDGGDLQESNPSTVLDLTKGEPQVLRAGPMSKAETRAFFEIGPGEKK